MGLEPTAYALVMRCSTTELLPKFEVFYHFMFYHQLLVFLWVNGYFSSMYHSYLLAFKFFLILTLSQRLSAFNSNIDGAIYF